MSKIKEFVKNNPVRLAAFISSAVALLSAFLGPKVPVEPVVAFILSACGLSELAQRTENKKTIDALFTEVPTVE